MPYEVLARKWRPQIFEDVVGQGHVTTTLINAMKTGRVAHAYLFAGPRGVGKTTVARILAKTLNCQRQAPENPCNQCHPCLEIIEGSSVDVQEIDGASNRGIDEIRELRGGIMYMPSSSRYRIYIIDEVHMLTMPAFNALLKTLEEPPAHVKFIFATTEAHKVPVTILSRCQRFDFRRIPLTEISGHLETIAREEGIEISTPSLNLIAREADGSMRDAESLLDQVVSFSGVQVPDKDVSDILGVIDRELVLEASQSLIEGSAGRCLEIVDKIYTSGHDIKAFYRSLMEQIRNLLVCTVSEDDRILGLPEEDTEALRSQAQAAGFEKLQMLLNFMIHREEHLRFSTHPKLVLETTLVKLCRLDDYLSFGALIEKLESLEKRLAKGRETLEAQDHDRFSAGVEGSATSIREKEDIPQALPEWEDFLGYVSSKNKSMSKVLKEWRFAGKTDGFLKIERGGQGISLSYFDDPGRLDRLRSYAKAFFGQDLEIEILDKEATGPEEHRRKPERKRNGKPEQDGDMPESVQEIMDIFQGKIEERTDRPQETEKKEE